MRESITSKLQQLEQIMRKYQLWRVDSPKQLVLDSSQPFSLDTLQPLEWLQWIFIPKMHSLFNKGEDLLNCMHYLYKNFRDS